MLQVMATHIIFEVVLAVATLFLGNVWRQLSKRAKFLRQAVSNQSYLDRFISKEMLLHPPSRIEPYVSKNSVGYFINIDVLLKADRSSQRRPRVISSVCLLAVLGVSLYLGYAYLAVNLVLLSLLGFAPITESAKHNTLEQIVTLAVILYRWREENAVECDNWVTQARSLHTLYAAVRRAAAA